MLILEESQKRICKNPDTQNVVHTKQASNHELVLTVTLASCSLIVYPADKGTSLTMHCPWAARRGQS